MNKKLYSIIIILLSVIEGISFAGTYGGGSGTSEDPYQIGTAEHLITLGETTDDYDKCFVLTADIDLSGYVFDRAVIAWDEDDENEEFDGVAFTGVFDGNGHLILNFTHSSVSGDYVGIFGKLENYAEINNLGIINPHINSGSGHCIGVLAGYSFSIIKNCFVKDGNVMGGSDIGILVGFLDGQIIGSYAIGNVVGNLSVYYSVANAYDCNSRKK